jgi:hypothetical protein
MLEEYATKEQHSVVRFYGQKDSAQRIFIKKHFLFMVGNVCLHKAVHVWLAEILLLTKVETVVQKWLRQQTKDVCAAFFSTLV